MRTSESKFRRLIREETFSILSEDEDEKYLELQDAGLSETAYERYLQKLGISSDDVIEIESGSTLGINAPGGWIIKTTIHLLGRNDLRKVAGYKG